ncbi:MAG: neuraminidase-like domain-containing protein [Acidobacteriota bacterium]
MPKQTFQILGRVIDQITRNGLPNLRVEAWDRDNISNDLLGQALTDTDGRFTIVFDDAKFNDGNTDTLPDLYLKVFAGKFVVYNSQDKPIQDWNQQQEALVIELNPKSPPLEVEPYVEGEVVRPDGTPLSNYPVRAFDRAICNWRQLGETNYTNDLGYYRIVYDPAQITAWGKTRADLKVQVYDPENQNDILATSPLLLQALPQEIVNFSIGQGDYRGLDEYSRVHRALAAMLQSVNDLNCINIIDVMILARESNISNSSAAYYVKAQRWAEQLQAPPAIFYGLLRQNQPARLDALFARPLSQLWSALKDANALNIINLNLNDTLHNRLEEIQNNYLAQPNHPFSRLLKTTQLNDQQRSVFIKLLTSGTLTREQFWKSLETEAGFSATQVAELKETLELQTFTGDNTSLSVHLRTKLNVRAPREVAALSFEQWRDEVLTAEGVEIPDDILPGQPLIERRTAYAQMLFRSAELNYPTRSLAAQISRSQSWNNQPIASFLTAYPVFEFTDQRITYFLQQHPETLNLFPDPNTGRQELLWLEQLFHLTPGTDKLVTIQPLWDAELRSARQITMIGRAQLQQKVGSALDKTIVNRIYQQAVHNTAVALNLYMRYHQGLNSTSLYAMRTAKLPTSTNISTSKSKLLSANTDLPEWSELFGSPDACECSHCQSALSPSAYLVDMMYFLQKATDGAGKNALDYLLERRPDLGTLQLTCENTNTELPQIDLVIEIMEEIVAHSVDGKSIPPNSIGQTTWDSKMLAAQPEHTEPEAYEKLREAVFPFDRLPFDLWLEEGRCYLKQMGIARDELMRALLPKSSVNTLQIATETLAMSNREQEIITTPNTTIASLAVYWGVDTTTGSLQEQLGDVQRLIKQARIEYDTLLKLLNTRYVNPDRRISIDFKDNPCSLKDARLIGPDGTTIPATQFRAFLDHLHRFIRLQRRLGWSEYELDMMINALGINDFNMPNFLAWLSDLKRLHETLDLSVDELCTWWGNLDTFVFDDTTISQYEAIFLDPAIFPNTHIGDGPDLRNDVFSLMPDRSDLVITVSVDPNLSHWLAESDSAAKPTYSLNPDYSSYIQSATRLLTEEILLLTDKVLAKDTTSGNVPLNLANLSLLYRIGSLTRALKISVQEYLYLVQLTGIRPITTSAGLANPINSMSVYQDLSEINESSFTIEELAYLLLHDSTAAAAYTLVPAELDVIVEQLSNGLIGIPDIATAKLNSDLLSALSQSLAVTLGLDATVLEALLFTQRPLLGNQLLEHLIIEANSDVSQPLLPFQELFERLRKFAIAWNGLGLDPSHLEFVLNQNIGWPDIAALPITEQIATDFAAWRRLVQAVTLQNSNFSVEQSLFVLLQAAADPDTILDDTLALVVESTGWNLTDVKYLTGPTGFNYTYPDDYTNERWLIALEKAISILQPLGVSASQAHSWTMVELTFLETESIKQALTLSYEKDRWLDVMASIQDELRLLKRDSLLAYLLNRISSNDSYDVYRYYLIDPEMQPCARTSRIVEAHAAVQLFVQRILLNLEPPLSFPREDAEGWLWRKNYRIWEAARKVFLYPENWLEPELRDNKSIFFKELEDGLLQDEVTFETAERLYGEYLTKLEQVSHLEIMGMYQDEETNVLHVFGRTAEMTKLYYYRRWEDEARWTPWERIEVDIQSDHLIPIVYNGQLYLFWPEIKVTGPESSSTIGTNSNPMAKTFSYDPATGNTSPTTGVDVSPPDDKPSQQPVNEKPAPTQSDEPTYQIELRMAWSQYNSQGWSAKTVSAHKISYGTDDEVRRHYFTGWISSENRLHIAIHINQIGGGEGLIEDYLGYFYFDDCHGELLFDAGEEGEAIHPNGEVYASSSVQKFQSLVFGSPTWSVTWFGLEIDGSTRTILNHLLSGGRLHYAHQYGLGGSKTSPFFFSDSEHTYFVHPISDLEFEINNFGSLENSFSQSTPASIGLPKESFSIAIAENVSQQVSTSNIHYGGINDTIISRLDSKKSTSKPAQETDFLTKVLTNEGDLDPLLKQTTGVIEEERRTSYLFSRFYHPYTCLFLKQLSRYGIEGLLNPDPDWGDDSKLLYRQLTPGTGFNFAAKTSYDPNTDWVSSDYPVEEIDFDHNTSYGSYNWELFFHIPLLIASRLMQNGRFSEARRWFNYIFDPTHSDGEPPAKFWKIKPFYNEQLKGATETIQELIDLLEQGSDQFNQQVTEWESDPFNPHVIARLRIAAYMKTTVMKYLDCLIAEADMLFTMDLRETINEATQLYLLAAEILGEKPVLLPVQESGILTANILLGRIKIDFDGLLWNQLDTLTSLLPTNLSKGSFSRTNQVILPNVSINAQGATSSYDTLFSFCIPYNEKLYDYWNTVADRLFKIRHCMNIDGVVRQLPLFAPPIDPALLVRASAAGLDIAAILSTLYEPLPKYRFVFMLQKAMELCSDLRSLGSELLAALEKKDAEDMALLRARHEVALLDAGRLLKERQLNEAEEALAAQIKAYETTLKRRDHYLGLLDKGLIEQENKYQENLAKANFWQNITQSTELLAAVLYAFPQIHIPGGVESGGLQLGQATQAVARVGGLIGANFSYQATRASIEGGNQRRKEDWRFQEELANKELAELDKQILVAEIRKQIAEVDLANHKKQIAQAEEAEAFLKTKFTNQELYSWMVSKLSSLYFQTYQIAYKLAKQAEKCFNHELGPDEKDSSYITNYYWDSLKKGLLAGEQLNYDLRRMENAHIEANRRELEITKHISLMQLDPAALLALRETGICEIHIPEVFFDIDFAGHYFRRIKAVRITIPCVVGPYTNVSATLRLKESWLRFEPNTTVDLVPVSGLPQTVIATSSANQDSGVFELNFNDPRYLPFEGAGVISNWELELPMALRSFDYDTITDVVIHISYTARDGADILQDGQVTFKQAVNEQLESNLNDLKRLLNRADITLARLFSLRQEFSSEWNRLLLATSDQPQEITLRLGKQHFPRYLDYLWEKNDQGILESHAIVLRVNSVQAFLNPKGVMPANAHDIEINGKGDTVSDVPGLIFFDAIPGISSSEIANGSVVDLELTVTNGQLRQEDWKDLYILLKYQVIS